MTELGQDPLAGAGGGPQTVTIDARGLACPMPVIMLARAATALSPGTELTVLATDPAARLDVPAWARMTGNAMVAETTTDGGAYALTVRVGSSSH